MNLPAFPGSMSQLILTASEAAVEQLAAAELIVAANQTILGPNKQAGLFAVAHLIATNCCTPQPERLRSSSQGGTLVDPDPQELEPEF